MLATLHKYAPLHYYCSLHIDPTLLNILVKTAKLTFIHYTIDIYVHGAIIPFCYIFIDIIFVMIYNTTNTSHSAVMLFIGSKHCGM